MNHGNQTCIPWSVVPRPYHGVIAFADFGKQNICTYHLHQRDLVPKYPSRYDNLERTSVRNKSVHRNDLTLRLWFWAISWFLAISRSMELLFIVRIVRKLLVHDQLGPLVDAKKTHWSKGTKLAFLRRQYSRMIEILANRSLYIWISLAQGQT